MGEAAEQLYQDPTTSPDLGYYGKSLRFIRYAGEVLRSRTVGRQERSVARESLRAEWDSSLGEMLKSNNDKERLSDKLEINRMFTFDIVDGDIMSQDGKTSLENIMETGLWSSRLAARKDKRMQTQVNRDKADLRNLQKVKQMIAGESEHNTIVVASLDPREAMKRDGNKFWEDFNYTEGMAFVQIYHLTKNGKLLTGTFSVDHSNKAVWRTLWAKQGVVIPEGEHSDNWLDYGVERNLSSDQVESFGRQLRKDYYQTHKAMTGRRVQQQFSINDILRTNQPMIDRAFSELYVPLAEATASGRKNAAITSFVSSLYLNQSGHLNAAVRQKLMKIHNSNRFDEEAARLVDHLIRYSVVEELRGYVKSVISPKRQHASASTATKSGVYSGRSLPHINPYDFIARMTGNVGRGAEAGRSYGGCPGGRVEIGNKLGNLLGVVDQFMKNFDPKNVLNPQDAFGGNGKEKPWHAGKIFKNEQCHCCKEVKAEVGACRICEECVKDPKKMQAAYEAEQKAAKKQAASQVVVSLFDRAFQKIESGTKPTNKHAGEVISFAARQVNAKADKTSRQTLAA